MMQRYICLCLLLLSGLPLRTRAQDSAKVLEVQDFLSQVMNYHPLVKQARLLSEYGRQEVRLARGAFDPKLSSRYTTKDFDNKTYYSLWNSEMKVPTWFGLEFKAGYERNSGVYINPEDRTPERGLEYLGVSVPLGQGLIIDMRRAALREAQYFKEISEAERIKLINKTILSAAKEYWEWYNSYYQYQLIEKGYLLAKVRFEAVVERVNQGDLAPIDSVEAKLIMQQREIDMNKIRVELRNAQLMVSNFLWNDNEEPLEMGTTITPAINANTQGAEISLEELLSFARENHPELLKITFKYKQLQVQRRLGIEMLKPTINFNYNALQLTGRSDKIREQSFFMNNYKFGVDFAFPLFLRKERAKLQQINIKMEQTDFERLQINREILNNIAATYNELKNLEQLLVLQNEMVNNYRLLYAGEQEKFANGESSLFLLNSRESKLLESEMKMVEMRAKYAKAKATLLWAAGKGI